MCREEAETPSAGSSGGAKDTDTNYCTSCGEPIKRRVEICPECGVRVRRSADATRKDPGIAAVISLIIPGAGQLYNEQFARGAVIFGSYALYWMFTFVLMFILIGFLFMLLAPFFHLFAAWDAYTQAKQLNRGEASS